MGTNVGIFVFVLFLCVIHEAMGVPTVDVASSRKQFPGNFFKKQQALPIQTTFQLPAPLPSWPPGNGFASGIIDLGGLQVTQITTFNKIWASYQGGPDDQGATIFEPTGIPQGFYSLGFYTQPNNKPLYGFVLVAKDVSNTNNKTLKQPLDYSLIWNSESLGISQDTPAYIWLPKSPEGYRAIGLVVTTTSSKPSLDKIMCVRSDLTDICEQNSVIWNSPNGFNFYGTRPTNRGTQSQGVPVGTFLAQNADVTGPLPISCLRNNNSISESMPNSNQIDSIMKAYSPVMFLHPDEEFLPSSVNWFFSNGGLLYQKGNESNPIPIAENGTNLPQDPNNDGAYWLDLPADSANKDRVKRGNLQSSKSYIHVKPMLGGTFSDIAIWVFYPFNGPARAKVGFMNVKLGKIGEHVGDWEHVTLRVSNFNGKLFNVYFSQHSHGIWVDASQIEYQSGNKLKYYSSLHGHASYPHPGLVIQGTNRVGIRNDTAPSDLILDMGGYEMVSADYLGVIEPPWIKYFREWGPKIDYNIDDELKKIEKLLPGKLKELLVKVVKSLPSEVLGEEGPTGPKVKNSWIGDEA